MANSPISVYDYEDYRVFLKEKTGSLKKQDPKWTLRKFAKLAHLKSWNFLPLVIAGKKNLSLETISKFSKALGLEKGEASYFKSIILFNQASTTEERQLYAQQVLKSKGFKNAHPLAEFQYRYFTRWHYTAIRELVSFPDFQNDPKWIVKRLDGQITEEQAREGITTLMKLGLLREGVKGTIEVIHERVVAVEGVMLAFVAQYHQQMMKKACEAIFWIPREEREILGATVRISYRHLQIIKEKLQEIRNEIVELTEQGQDSAGIYQLNLQFFPLMRFPK